MIVHIGQIRVCREYFSKGKSKASLGENIITQNIKKMEKLSPKEIEQLLIIDKEIIGSADYFQPANKGLDSDDGLPTVTVFTTMFL